MSSAELLESLTDHLAWWGLRRWHSDAAYFQWQRRLLRPSDLARLNDLAARKRREVAAEIAFYDLSADPAVLPVLYSQRYDYYMAVGPLIAERIPRATRVLDFGCGPGILTSFYARRFPSTRFVGLDRSSASIAAADEHCRRLGLTNVRFECTDLEEQGGAGLYDLIIASHALLQSEQEPGLPSAGWQTFERLQDAVQQEAFERRTGVGRRLDRLAACLTSDGRVLLFEKARQLSRRIPLQRALAARGLSLLEPPLPIRYLTVEDVTDDGPLYVLERGMAAPRLDWFEDPEWVDGDDLYTASGPAAEMLHRRLPERSRMEATEWGHPQYGALQVERGLWGQCLSYLDVRSGQRRALVLGHRETVQRLDRESPVLQRLLATPAPPARPAELDTVPLYENHTVWAQAVWTILPSREVLKAVDRDEGPGRSMHVELGRAGSVVYLYCANAMDQRQLVIMEPARATVLEEYYQEIAAGTAERKRPPPLS
ncbi:class I SAM-dependent methyltransferase [Candidatus Nitrospira bockiana]